MVWFWPTWDPWYCSLLSCVIFEEPWKYETRIWITQHIKHKMQCKYFITTYNLRSTSQSIWPPFLGLVLIALRWTHICEVFWNSEITTTVEPFRAPFMLHCIVLCFKKNNVAAQDSIAPFPSSSPHFCGVHRGCAIGSFLFSLYFTPRSSLISHLMHHNYIQLTHNFLNPPYV